jgi:Kef-type K+ transport system membrane component KefB
MLVGTRTKGGGHAGTDLPRRHLVGGQVSPSSLGSLLLVMVIAALAPIISRLVPGRPPQVLLLIVGGVLIGPHVLGFADTSDIELLAGLGLGFLFLLAGHELDPQLLREKAGRQALVVWAISACCPSRSSR